MTLIKVLSNVSIAKKEFCVGCHRNKIYDEEKTICLKAYFKLLYYRVINIISSYGRYESYEYNDIFMSILILLLYIPFFSAMISYQLSFRVHKKRENSLFIVNYNHKGFNPFFDFFSSLKGLLMFPYIITFLPFILILLLPCIFSKNYYIFKNRMFTAIFFLR